MLRSVLELRPSLRAVGEAGDGNEAVAEAARLQPDVILLDLAMPRRSGLERLPEIRRVAPAAHIIVFSGFSMATVAEEAVELGAVSYRRRAPIPTRSTTRSRWPPGRGCRVSSGPVRSLDRTSRTRTGPIPASLPSVPIGMHSRRMKVVLALLPLAVAGSAVLPATVTRIAVGGNPCGNAFAFGSIWVAAAGSDTLVRVDPKRNRPVGRVHVGRAPCGVAAVRGACGSRTSARRESSASIQTMKVIARIAAGRNVRDVLFQPAQSGRRTTTTEPSSASTRRRTASSRGSQPAATPRT